MNSNMPHREYLHKEIEYIISTIFPGETIDEVMKLHYLDFNEQHLAIDGSINLKKILNLRLDIEAIEFYLRLRNRNNILTKKFQAIVYLVEIKSQFYTSFYLEKDNFFGGWVYLTYFTIRSIYKYFKGSALVRIYAII